MTDRVNTDTLLGEVRKSLLKWQAFPTIPGSLKWSRDGLDALDAVAAALREAEKEQAECRTPHLEVQLAESLARERQLREAQQASDEILSRWFNAYRTSVFRPLSVEQVANAVNALKESGITSDALHAAWARHLLHHVMREITEARAALAVSSGDTNTEPSDQDAA